MTPKKKKWGWGGVPDCGVRSGGRIRRLWGNLSLNILAMPAGVSS